jgi:lysophospholipase L1-like esterase
LSYNSKFKFWAAKVPPWALPIGVFLSATALGGVLAMAREIFFLRQELSNVAVDRDSLSAQLGKIELARAALRGFGLDYYGRDNLALFQEKPAPKRVIFYGDSITEFWNLPKYFSGLSFKAVNRGIKGQETEHLLARSYFDVLMLKPWAVVLTAGTNDALKLASEERITTNLDVMIYGAHREGARVFVGTLPPVELPDSPMQRKTAALIDRVNGWIRRRCDGKTCTTLDFNAALKHAEKASHGSALKDGVHPSDAGYEAMAKLVRAALKGAGG